jgi:hypothetical protein
MFSDQERPSFYNSVLNLNMSTMILWKLQTFAFHTCNYQCICPYPNCLVEMLFKVGLKSHNVKVSVQHFLFQARMLLESVSLPPVQDWPPSPLGDTWMKRIQSHSTNQLLWFKTEQSTLISPEKHNAWHSRSVQTIACPFQALLDLTTQYADTHSHNHTASKTKSAQFTLPPPPHLFQQKFITTSKASCGVPCRSSRSRISGSSMNR